MILLVVAEGSTDIVAHRHFILVSGEQHWLGISL